MELISFSENIYKCSISPFLLNEGNIMLLSLPFGMDVEFCKKNIEPSIKIRKQPYWVKFSMEKLNKESVDIINQNKEYLNPYFSSKFIPNRILSKKEISLFSGWDIRLINMFLKREQYNVDFFEINIAGLSYNSIKLMFDFIFKEQETNLSKLTYLIVTINKKEFKFNPNPIIVDKSNINEILQNL